MTQTKVRDYMQQSAESQFQIKEAVVKLGDCLQELAGMVQAIEAKLSEETPHHFGRRVEDTEDQLQLLKRQLAPFHKSRMRKYWTREFDAKFRILIEKNPTVHKFSDALFNPIINWKAVQVHFFVHVGLSDSLGSCRCCLQPGWLERNSGVVKCKLSFNWAVASDPSTPHKSAQNSL